MNKTDQRWAAGPLAWAREMDQLLGLLREKKLKVGFAESCTGGLLSASMASIAGVSDVYMGTIVSYSYEAKQDLLGVDPDLLKRVGAVSEEIALQMVRGALPNLRVDCAVAITGIAGPSGGTPEKPVGTVWFGFKGPGFEVAEQRHFTGDRAAVQAQSVHFALQRLVELLWR